jgi:hypothetical protein
MFADSGRFPPVDVSMPRLAPATIFRRCETDLGGPTSQGTVSHNSRRAMPYRRSASFAQKRNPA